MSEHHRIIVDSLPELKFLLKVRERELVLQISHAAKMAPRAGYELAARLEEVRHMLSYIN